MINKMRTAQEAVAGIQDGMTVMVGGFLGTGTPEIVAKINELLAALRTAGVIAT